MPLCELGPSCPVPDPRGMAGAIFVPLSTHRLPTQLRTPQKCDGHHSYWLRPDLVLKHEGGDENPEANRGFAMANSSALSRFPARTIGQTGFATLFAGALAVIPAFAGDAVALIEGLTSPSQRVELMVYAHVGQVIHLNTDQTMVLSYRDTCIRETITGGTITIGTGQSEVRSAARLERVQNTCELRKVDVSRTEGHGGRAFRGLSAAPVASGF